MLSSHLFGLCSTYMYSPLLLLIDSSVLCVILLRLKDVVCLSDNQSIPHFVSFSGVSCCVCECVLLCVFCLDLFRYFWESTHWLSLIAPLIRTSSSHSLCWFKQSSARVCARVCAYVRSTARAFMHVQSCHEQQHSTVSGTEWVLRWNNDDKEPPVRAPALSECHFTLNG